MQISRGAINFKEISSISRRHFKFQQISSISRYPGNRFDYTSWGIILTSRYLYMHSWLCGIISGPLLENLHIIILLVELSLFLTALILILQFSKHATQRSLASTLHSYFSVQVSNSVLYLMYMSCILLLSYLYTAKPLTFGELNEIVN